MENTSFLHTCNKMYKCIYSIIWDDNGKHTKDYMQLVLPVIMPKHKTHTQGRSNSVQKGEKNAKICSARIK